MQSRGLAAFIWVPFVREEMPRQTAAGKPANSLNSAPMADSDDRSRAGEAAGENRSGRTMAARRDHRTESQDEGSTPCQRYGSLEERVKEAEKIP